MKKYLLLAGLLTLSGIFPILSAAVPASPLSTMQIDSLRPVPDSNAVKTLDRAEVPSKIARVCAIIALATALSFLVIGFQARLGFAMIFLLASLVGLGSGFSAMLLSKPKTKSRRRGALAVLFIILMLGTAALIAAAELL